MITRGACAEKCLIRGHAAGLGIGGQRIGGHNTHFLKRIGGHNTHFLFNERESKESGDTILISSLMNENRGTQYSFPQKNRNRRIGGHNTHFLFNERESRGNLGRISQNQNLGTQYSFPLLLKSGDKQLISSHKSASAIGGHHNYILTQSA